MKVLLIASLLVWRACLSVSAEGAPSPLSRAQARRDATNQLNEALRTKNWKLVKESAEELDMLDKLDKQESGGTPESVVNRASEAGFSLSRSPDEEKKGARFGFSRDYAKSSGTVLESDFYLKWTAKPWNSADRTLWNAPALSAQGKVSSANHSELDAWRFRLEDSLWTYNPATNRVIDGFVFSLSAKSENDRDFKTSRLGGELWVTPNTRKLLIGQYSGDNDSVLQFRWRPYVGLDVGGTLADAAAASDDTKSPVWAMGRLRADLRLSFVRKLLRINDVVLYADDKLVDTTETGKTHNYLNTGLDLELNDNVGFTLEYTTGEDSPNFKREQVFKGGLTVKF